MIILQFATPKRTLLLLTAVFWTFFMTAQNNVGVGTNTPEAKLHVAGDLKVDSALIIDGLALKDSTGDLRLKLDPNTGSIQWWHKDTLFHQISVNSPTRTVHHLPDGGRVERSVGKSDLPLSNTNEDNTAYYDKNGQLQRAIRRYEPGAYHPLGKLIFEDVTYDNDTTCRKYSFERVVTTDGKILEYRTWYKCLGEFSQTKVRQVCKDPNFTVVTEYSPTTGEITSWKHSSLSNFKIDSLTGRAIEITDNPKEGKRQIMHFDSSGNKMGSVTFGFPNGTAADAGEVNNNFTIEGPNNGTFRIELIDTLPNPLFQFPEDITLGISQDNGHLTVSNIGSSGLDGVRIDLGEDGDPAMGLFNGDDGLLDLLLELDSQVNDGFIRTTDPVTGEVIIVGMDPDHGRFGIGSSGQDGFTIQLPADSNNQDNPQFRIFGSNGEGATFRLFDTIPQAGTPRDITVSLNQDQGHLTVSNIGSSGEDGVSVDLGLDGDPEMRLFTETNDGLLDLLLELDSQERDGFIRMTDPVTGEVIIVGIDPDFGAVGIGSSGQDGFRFELPSDSNDVNNPQFRIFGANGEGATFRLGDTIPQAGTPRDITVNLDQDNGHLTVSNIGSSGEDGVSIDLGLNGDPEMRLFTETDDGLLDLLLELDSQEKDGFIRMTDPVTGEVIIVGIDPDFGKVGIGSSGQDGFTFELPSDSNDVDGPTFRLFGEHGEGATIRVCDTLPPIGIARDLTINLDQDNGAVTIDNIGSSGCDGVRIDLGDSGNPSIGLFNDDNNTLLDLLLELDSQEKDGFIRMTDPSTGEVVIVGFDPSQATVSSTVGGNLLQSTIFDENNNALFFRGADTNNNQVQMVMLPGQQQVEFFAGNQPGNPPVNVVIHGEVQAMGNVEVGGNIQRGGNPVIVQGGLQVIGGPKNFKIDHPLDPYNKYLIHNSIESPDMMNVYNGNITTDENGYATVELPGYFEALNRDFRYQLTVIGTFAQAIVKEKINNNRFVIQTNAPGVEVSWQVTGIRNDAAARERGLPAEMEKEPDMKGQLLYPVR